jgi:cell division protein YceG involved in septum cleavage
MMEEGDLMRKRISLLIAALMLALTMSFGAVGGVAFADPNCGQVGGNNKNCQTVVVGPGESENSQGNAQDKNKNIKEETTFKGRPQ